VNIIFFVSQYFCLSEPIIFRPYMPQDIKGYEATLDGLGLRLLINNRGVMNLAPPDSQQVSNLKKELDVAFIRKLKQPVYMSDPAPADAEKALKERRASLAPLKKQKTTREEREFEFNSTMGSNSLLRDRGRTRRDTTSRINSACETLSPDKGHRRSSIVRAPVRAAVFKATPLVMTLRFEAPQQSAYYGGYRSSVHVDGLENLCNTCYLNAVMQSICSLREFVDFLREMLAWVPRFGGSELFKRTDAVLRQMGSAGTINPARLRERIAMGNPMFGNNVQQDAHEFFLKYVGQLHDELLAAREDCLKVGGEGEGRAVGDAVLATEAYLDSELQKRIVCIQCDHTRHVAEKFRDFSLDFCGHPGANACSVEAMLQEYFADELLEAKCERCAGTAARLEKRLVVTPRLLVLHFKRFIPNLEKRSYDKRHEAVAPPLKLD
jgi:hypothetical protein